MGRNAEQCTDAAEDMQLQCTEWVQQEAKCFLQKWVDPKLQSGAIRHMTRHEPCPAASKPQCL